MYSFPLPSEFRNGLHQPTGQFAHANWPESKYAVDILCPAGTPVYAARAGKVILVQDGFYEWGLDKELSLKVNLVGITHEDGTGAEYLHLAAGKMLVKRGDTVSTGQQLGETGLSGCMSHPHLHFNVFRIENGKGYSIPFEFSDGL